MAYTVTSHMMGELVEIGQRFTKQETNDEKKASKRKKREKKIYKFKMDILEKMLYKVSLIRHCDQLCYNFMMTSTDYFVYKDPESDSWQKFISHFEVLKVSDEEAMMKGFYRFV